MLQQPDQDKGDKTPGASAELNFTYRPQIKRNEEIIWGFVRDEIERTIDYLAEKGPVQVVEIGGASLTGLECLSQSPYFKQIKYLIVDEAPPANPNLLSELGAQYSRSKIQHLSKEQLGIVHFAVAVRALEYDPDYGTIFNKLHNHSGYPAYGIFIHNAENSAVFKQVRDHSSLIQFRLHAIKALQAALDNRSVLYNEPASTLFDFTMLPDERVPNEQSRLNELLKRLAPLTDDQRCALLQKKAAFFQNQADKLANMYGERLISRRFWGSSNDELASSYYRKHSLHHLQRANVELLDSGLRVHIDTVDLHNLWARSGRTFPPGVIPEAANIDLALR